MQAIAAAGDTVSILKGDGEFEFGLAFDVDAFLKLDQLHTVVGSDDDDVSLSTFDGSHDTYAQLETPPPGKKPRRRVASRPSPRLLVVKQRCHKKDCRVRVKSMRASGRIKCLRAEQGMREVLARQTKQVVIVFARKPQVQQDQQHKQVRDDASKPFRDQLTQALLERDAIAQDNATMASSLALLVAFELWGFKSPKDLNVRAEINELPDINMRKKYAFEW